MHLADGVALWERYNRCALEGLVGLDTFVVRFEDIVEDPSAQFEAIATWLGRLPQFTEHARSWDLVRAVESISPELQRQASTEDELLLSEQSELVSYLKALAGPHHPLSPLPEGSESPWTTALLGDRHQLATLSRQRDELGQTARKLWFENQEATAQVEALRREIGGLHTQIEVLEDDLKDTQKLYERIQASTSWRVTRPLRRVMALRRSDSA